MTEGTHEGRPGGGSDSVESGSWQRLAGLHRVLSGLAGRLPDALVTQTREWLGAEDVQGMPEVLAASTVAKGLSLTPYEAEALLAALTDADPTAVRRDLLVSDVVAPTAHRFEAGGAEAALGSGDPDPALVDQTVVQVLYQTPGVVSIRRAVRVGTGAEPARRVYLFEADPGRPAWRPVLTVQKALTAIGQDAPQVEGYWTGEAGSPYQQAALEASVPLWVRPPLPERGSTVFGYALDPGRVKRVSEWYLWETEVWHTLTRLHRMLLRLAGQLSGERLQDARRLLAVGKLGPLVSSLAGWIAADALQLTADEIAMLRMVPAQIGAVDIDLAALDRVRVAKTPDPPLRRRFGFSAAPPGRWDPRDEDASANLVMMLAGQPGVSKVLRAWRASADGDSAGTPVFLVEVEPGLAAWDVAFDGQLALTLGGRVASVEAFWTDDGLPAYQRAAWQAAALLWDRTRVESRHAGGIRVAGVYDLAGPDGRPGFAADHPRLDDRRECDRLAARMVSGDVVVGNRVLAADVVDPKRGRIVPLAYHTDGQWIWRLSTAYYLAEYGLSPHPDLLEHLRAMERGSAGSGTSSRPGAQDADGR